MFDCHTPSRSAVLEIRVPFKRATANSIAMWSVLAHVDAMHKPFAADDSADVATTTVAAAAAIIFIRGRGFF
jgi:hypothetical protein